MKKYCLILMMLLGVSACATLPPELETTQPLITDYQQWSTQLANSKQSDLKTSSDVRMGGVISKLTNLEDSTRLEIVNLPISSTGRPALDVEPEGRFVAYIKGFLDPVAYKEGRLITVQGKSKPTEKGKVGQYDYQFPVIEASAHHLWQIKTTTYIDDPFWGDCYRGSIFCDGYYGPARATVIQELK
ncbi:MAG: Slp family lipoprotein [Vibrio sp.]